MSTLLEAPTLPDAENPARAAEVCLLNHEHLPEVLVINAAVEAKLTELHKPYLIAHKTEAQLRGYLGSGRMVGSFARQGLVAYGFLGRTSAEAPEAGVGGILQAGGCYRPERTGVIQTVMVHPEHWHRGHGKRIVREQLALAGRLGLETLVSMACTDNPESLHNMLRLKLRAIGAGIDASDGSQVVYLQGSVRKSLAALSAPRAGEFTLEGKNISMFNPHPPEYFSRLQSLLRKGWKGVQLQMPRVYHNKKRGTWSKIETPFLVLEGPRR